MHLHLPGPRVLPPHDDLFVPGEHQLAFDRVDPIIDRRHGYPLAQGEPIGLAERLLGQCSRLGRCRHVDGLGRRHLAERAVTDRQHLVQPADDVRMLVDQHRGHRRSAQEPQAVRNGEIRQRRRRAEQEFAFLARQLLLQPGHEGRPVVLCLLQRDPAYRTTAEQLRTILAEHLGKGLGHLGKAQRQGGRLEHQAHRVEEQHRVSPLRQRRDNELLAFGEQCRRGLFRFEATRDQGGVAIDIRADLQHRRAPITAGQSGQVRLWHHRRNGYRAPRQLLEAQQKTRLLGEWRGGIVVQDEFVHGRLRRWMSRQSLAARPERA